MASFFFSYSQILNLNNYFNDAVASFTRQGDDIRIYKVNEFYVLHVETILRVTTSTIMEKKAKCIDGSCEE